MNILENIVHSAVANRTKIGLEIAQSKMKYYVQNQSYFRAKAILDKHNYCIIAGIPGIGKTTLAEALFLDYVQQGFEPINVYSTIEEAFELMKPDKPQVFYFDDFLGQTMFEETNLGKNQDKQLLAFLQSVKQSGGNKKFILTTRDYILRQARISFESLRSTNLNPHQCIVNLHNYTRFNKSEILYNHVYFSELSYKHKQDLMRDRRYLAIIDHRNYSPRVIDWMTQNERWLPTDSVDFGTAFLEVLENPDEIWRNAFERKISFAAQYVLLVLVSLPARVYHDDLEEVFRNYYRYMCAARSVIPQPTAFRDALEELEGTFININVWSAETTVIQFHNPSVRDFLETHLASDPDSILALLSTARYFTQLQWLWGKPRIGGLEVGRPFPIRPKYRSVLIDNKNSFLERLEATLDSKSPLAFTAKTAKTTSTSSAGRLIFLHEVNGLLRDSGLDRLEKNNLANINERARLGTELAFELEQLARQVKGSGYFDVVKEAFLLSLKRIPDFERYLVFRYRYRDSMTSEDQAFVEERLDALYPGRTLDSVQNLPDDDPPEPDDEELDEWDDEEEIVPTDPDQAIVDLFESLTNS